VSDVRTFDTPGPVLLKLALSSGQADITTGDGTQTTVELVGLRGDDGTRQAIEEIQVGVRERGGVQEVYVEQPKKSGFRLGGFLRDSKIGVRITCPHGAALDASSASMDLQAHGRLGDVNVKTASGDTSIEVVEGTCKVNSASGDVFVRAARGTTSVNTASGDVRLGEAHGEVAANLISGDLTIGDAFGSIHATTVSGDQELESVRAGEIRLNSVSGDVRVAVARGVKLWIDANSVSGDMRSDLEVGELPPADDAPLVQLRAKTVSGDVSIVRAATQVSA